MFDVLIDILLSFATAFVITFLAIPKIIFFAQKFRLYDSAGAKNMILGIAKKVITNAVANESRISMRTSNILSF
jgi:hypothetical protein